MATHDVYFNRQIFKNGKSYEIVRQMSIGNTEVAKQEKQKLLKEYPKPKYLVKRKEGFIVVYTS